MGKTCNHCGDTEGNDTFAMAMLKSYHKQATRWYITALVILAMWLATIGMFVWYIQLYDYETYEITADDGGNANYQNGDGLTINSRGRNAKRDSMGRYSSEGGSYDDGSSYDDYSERTDRRYSRDDAKDHMMNKLGSMMENADPNEREILKDCMRKLERA